MKASRMALIVFVAGTVLSLASAANAGVTQVSGVQTPVGSENACFSQDVLASYTMDGGLVGCWYIDTFDIRGEGQPSGTIQATGTEHFVGCLDSDGDGACGAGDPQGTFGTTFQFSGKYDVTTGAEIHGRCHHPIVSGTGDFAGGTGVLNFTDIVTTGASLYTGNVSL